MRRSAAFVGMSALTKDAVELLLVAQRAVPEAGATRTLSLNTRVAAVKRSPDENLALRALAPLLTPRISRFSNALFLPEIFRCGCASTRTRRCARGIRYTVRRRNGSGGAGQNDFPVTMRVLILRIRVLLYGAGELSHRHCARPTGQLGEVCGDV